MWCWSTNFSRFGFPWHFPFLCVDPKKRDLEMLEREIAEDWEFEQIASFMRPLGKSSLKTVWSLCKLCFLCGFFTVAGFLAAWCVWFCFLYSFVFAFWFGVPVLEFISLFGGCF